MKALPDKIKQLERHQLDKYAAELEARAATLHRDRVELLKALEPFGKLWPTIADSVLQATGLSKIDFEHAAILYQRYRDEIGR